MSPTDYWIKDEMMDILSDDVAVARRFLDRYVDNDPVGTTSEFAYATLLWMEHALVSLARRVLDDESLSVANRSTTAAILVFAAPWACSEHYIDRISDVLNVQIKNAYSIDEIGDKLRLINIVINNLWDIERLRTRCKSALWEIASIWDVPLANPNLNKRQCAALAKTLEKINRQMQAAINETLGR